MDGIVVEILPIPTMPILSDPCDCNFARSAFDSPFESEQVPPLGATAMLAKLLTTGSLVCTAIEMKHPEMPVGTLKLIWSRPEQQPDRPTKDGVTVVPFT